MTAAVCGCSSPAVGVASDPVAAVRNAAAEAGQIHTAKVATVVQMSADGTNSQLTGLGEFDFDRQIGIVAVTNPRNARPLDEISTPNGLYLRISGTDGKWTWVDATKLPDGDLISAGYTSPVFDFALLHGVSNSGVRYLGQDTVRETPVAHYSGTLDLTASANQAQSPIKDELLAASRSFSGTTVPFDVYLDSQGELRRVVAHFSFRAPASPSSEVHVAATTDLFDLDQPVTVETPSAHDMTMYKPSVPKTRGTASGKVKR
jgi:hypothetical protein